MSSIDQSLDEILAAKPRQSRKARPNKASATNGVKKSTTKSSTKASTPASKVLAKVPESSKIIIHGLPADVTEKQVREYITAEIGPVARCELAYNSHGVSKGSATIIFKSAAGKNYATKACSYFNGRVLNAKGTVKPTTMRVEIITEVPRPGLAERLGSLPKSVQDSVARTQKKNGANTSSKTKGDARSKKSGKPVAPGRVKRVAKTTEDLDAEMEDYFGANK